MIETTFCHLPGVSVAREKDMWRHGIRTWDDLLCQSAIHDNDDRYRQLQGAVARSRRAVKMQEPAFFLNDLPESEWFRIYPDFRPSLWFLDIETDALDEDATITCLSLMKRGTINTFAATEDLDSAAQALAEARNVVTFNGAKFDIPRLMRRFSGFCPRHHLDLARILRKRKIRGTLKGVAATLGWKNAAKPGAIATGKEAAQAWTAYRKTGKRAFIDALKDYNQQDVRILEFVLKAVAQRHLRTLPP